MRKYLGVRYDARLNLFDWDYQMRLAQRDVSTELSLYNMGAGPCYKLKIVSEYDQEIPQL